MTMPKKILFCNVILFLSTAIFVIPCFAQPVGSLELINNAKQYDGKTVIYQGEAIGDIMIRADHAWIHLNDGYIAIGVWVRKDGLKDIAYLGNYRAKGDIIEVTGVFHRCCPEHGGDLDIHAWEIRKIAPGEDCCSKFSIKKLYIGLFLTLVVLFFAFCLRYFKP
jgi:hypothetical protein